MQEAFDPLQYLIVGGVAVLDRVLDLAKYIGLSINARSSREARLLGIRELQRVQKNIDCRHVDAQIFLELVKVLLSTLGPRDFSNLDSNRRFTGRQRLVGGDLENESINAFSTAPDCLLRRIILARIFLHLDLLDGD